MRGADIIALGFTPGPVVGQILKTLATLPQADFVWSARLSALLAEPTAYLQDETWGAVAALLVAPVKPKLLDEALVYPVYGTDIEEGARRQMDVAMRLPITAAGALMPDAHQGYGLPIGGVLATRNAVIPYGVGVDIGCRMCLSILPIPAQLGVSETARLERVLLTNTRFGEQREHETPNEAAVLEDARFGETPLLRGLHERARYQLGTSGSGNHFVEFGEIAVPAGNTLGVPAGSYLALLTHSGSRGLGANIARHYTKLAIDQTPLPPEAKNLAWLGLDTEAGQEYWRAMNLAGDYAAACHDDIHRRVLRALGGIDPLARVENHHNFAWEENHLVDGRPETLLVHRKGATPAGEGVLGIIPGSMATPGYVVRGRGNASSLASASHGAGRRMSRTVAKQTYTAQHLQETLAAAGVTLLGGGLDEIPMAYKDITQVMAQQADLVSIQATFTPRVVRMDTE